MPIKKQTIDWTYLGKPITCLDNCEKDSIGFIYLITNLSNGKKYYGRKTFRALSKKKRLTKTEKKLPENSRKTFKYVEHEYKGWQEYNGSCQPLLEDISRGDKIQKEIVRFCYNKKQLTAWELKYIMCDCFLEDNCYNGNIMGKLFRKDYE